MATQKSDQLPDVTYWLALQIANSDPAVDLDSACQGSVELDVLYQLLTSKAQLHWRCSYGIELSLVTVNNAFFRAIAMLRDRHAEFARLRRGSETGWVKELLHL